MKHKNKKTQKWNKKTLRMKDNHTWIAPDGYKIVVLDRGAVSFNIPESWIMAKMEPLELNDGEPPNDNARVSVSFWRLPPGVDWTGLPLDSLLANATDGSELEILERTAPVSEAREDIELMWTQHRFMDPVEHREAYTRIVVGRGWDIQLLITVDLWVDDVEKFQAMWDELLRSIQLGRHIEDPTKGAVNH